jgi:hypothetical protein
MPEEMPTPRREDAFVVFAQRSDARIDVQVWSAHAERFFATRLGLTADKRYGGDEPSTDQATFVVAPEGEPPGIRHVFARPGQADDFALAEAADTAGTGLALLARRCGMVWLVLREMRRDPLALRLAAILASVLLGPILDYSANELFGVKTARAKLDRFHTSDH